MKTENIFISMYKYQISTRIIASIPKYKCSYNCLYSCLITVCIHVLNFFDR